MAQGRPDFVGIGAQKAATTWLFKRLCMHPEIYFPSGKEIHFWDQRDKKDRPLKAYEAIFSGYQITHIGGKTGEITPAYMTVSDARLREFSEMAPDVRLLVILRNPIDRAISAAAQVARTHGIVPGRRHPLFSAATTEAGLYGRHLARWLQYFPPERLHVITHEDIRKNAVEVLRGVSRHIGVDPDVYNLIDPSLLNATTSPSPNRIKVTEDQRTRLKRIYHKDVASLEKLLGRTFGWLT